MNVVVIGVGGCGIRITRELLAQDPNWSGDAGSGYTIKDCVLADTDLQSFLVPDEETIITKDLEDQSRTEPIPEEELLRYHANDSPGVAAEKQVYFGLGREPLADNFKERGAAAQEIRELNAQANRLQERVIEDERHALTAAELCEFIGVIDSIRSMSHHPSSEVVYPRRESVLRSSRGAKTNARGGASFAATSSHAVLQPAADELRDCDVCLIVGGLARGTGGGGVPVLADELASFRDDCGPGTDFGILGLGVLPSRSLPEQLLADTAAVFNRWVASVDSLLVVDNDAVDVPVSEFDARERLVAPWITEVFQDANQRIAATVYQLLTADTPPVPKHHSGVITTELLRELVFSAPISTIQTVAADQGPSLTAVRDVYQRLLQTAMERVGGSSRHPQPQAQSDPPHSQTYPGRPESPAPPSSHAASEPTAPSADQAASETTGAGMPTTDAQILARDPTSLVRVAETLHTPREHYEQSPKQQPRANHDARTASRAGKQSETSARTVSAGTQPSPPLEVTETEFCASATTAQNSLCIVQARPAYVSAERAAIENSTVREYKDGSVVSVFPTRSHPTRVLRYCAGITPQCLPRLESAYENYISQLQS